MEACPLAAPSAREQRTRCAHQVRVTQCYPPAFRCRRRGSGHGIEQSSPEGVGGRLEEPGFQACRIWVPSSSRALGWALGSSPRTWLGHHRARSSQPGPWFNHISAGWLPQGVDSFCAPGWGRQPTLRLGHPNHGEKAAPEERGPHMGKRHWGGSLSVFLLGCTKPVLVGSGPHRVPPG